jgi:spermidine/putrescine ABC transporter ATP-binding subunit
MDRMSQVVFQKVRKEYSSFTALETLDLTVNEGEFLTLLGPSGCGKTTTLRLIAGFLEPTGGRILIDGEDVTGLPPQKRGIGMVFQDYALFPHLTIGENIAFGLVERGVAKDKVRARVRELLELVRLPNVEQRYPSEISGGQAQRVALARAVAFTPRVLLMDEPLGALDLKLREAMQLELRRIQQELRITTVYVTHDQIEAMSMSDRIVVMNLGRIEQIGTPDSIYNEPQSRFVADFVGKISFVSGHIERHGGRYATIRTAAASVDAPISGVSPGGEVTVAIRPEKLFILPPDAPANGINVLEGVVETSTFVGSVTNIRVRVSDGTSLLVEARADDQVLAPGNGIRVGWKPDDSIVLAK